MKTKLILTARERKLRPYCITLALVAIDEAKLSFLEALEAQVEYDEYTLYNIKKPLRYKRFLTFYLIISLLFIF